MARVTVEDCVVLLPNRFDLVILASHRAKALGAGAEIKVPKNRDKNPVIALREIAESKLNLDDLNDSLIKSFQKHIEPEKLEAEIAELMASEQQAWHENISVVSMEEDADDLFDDEDDEEELSMEDDVDMGTFEDAEDLKD
ncbi:MAG: DNA-directed RNA polymerase subunit omega [Alphaproteobacteria bacterium]|nr:DNA-directed RNA polymerase subunit omega [Alphaproteobacteria bacterium]MCL2505789.1 DNA-directed RNA polymerase subunit omega [Alphaproteobacteria bacterium]